jgi:hypothetical protein
VGLQYGVGWKLSVVVPNEHTNQNVTVLIDYCFLPIRYKYCLLVEYYLRDCNNRPGQRLPKKILHKGVGPTRYPMPTVQEGPQQMDPLQQIALESSAPESNEWKTMQYKSRRS